MSTENIMGLQNDKKKDDMITNATLRLQYHQI
jgi:hypothetical protein